MKIYTKTGDSGATSLIDGKRVSKSDDRIEAYGTLDELNSYIGLLVVKLPGELSEEIALLSAVQREFFVIGSHLAIEKIDPIYRIPSISVSMVANIEDHIDVLQASLAPLRYFVLPGGNEAASYCHIARCICRRAERNVVRLSMKESVNENVVKILNRFSDYLFVLARKVISLSGNEEIFWIPDNA